MPSDGCVFCSIVAKRIPATVHFEDELAIAFNDINPAAEVHVLIVPKRHVRDLEHATDADRDLLGHLLRTAAAVAAKLGVAEQGYKLLLNNGSGGGQVVMHIHLHLLAGRRKGHLPG